MKLDPGMVINTKHFNVTNLDRLKNDEVMDLMTEAFLSSIKESAGRRSQQTEGIVNSNTINNIHISQGSKNFSKNVLKILGARMVT
jgi:hypothetical protein